MSDKQYIGMVIGVIGIAIGLFTNPLMTLAVYVMMWGDNIVRDDQ